MVLLRRPVDRLPLRNRKQWATNLLLGALATEFLGASITVPIMAQYAASFNVHKGLVGLVFSVGSFATLLSDLWLPRISDTYGRKLAIVLSLAGSTAAYAMETMAPTFDFLLFASFVGGMFGGTPPVAIAYISDIYPPEERPRYIGMVPAIVSSCFILGPTVGGFLSNASNSFRVPIGVSTVVCGALALPLAALFIPDSKYLVSEGEKNDIDELNKTQERVDKEDFSVRFEDNDEVVDEASELLGIEKQHEIIYPGPWKDWHCWVCLVISLSSNTVFSCFVTTIPLVLEEPVFGLASGHDAVYYTGLVLGCGACIQAMGMVLLFNKVQARFGLVYTVYIGTFVSLVGYIFISFQTSVLGMAAGFGIFTLGNCLTRPGYTSHLTTIVPTEVTARAIAMISIAANIAGLLSPIASSEILAMTNYATLYRIASCFVLFQLVWAVSFLKSKSDRGEKKAPERAKTIETEVGHMNEEEFLAEFARTLKHRNYNLRCPRTQRAILAITKRSFPYLNDAGCRNEEEVCHLFDELNLTECREQQSKSRKMSIAKSTSCRMAASQLTQLGE